MAGTSYTPAAMEARAGDPLPTSRAIVAAKQAAIAGMTAELANRPWPPGPDAHALLDLTPLLALAALEATCGEVALPRLARCLGLDPIEAPERLAAARASHAWPGRVFRAAMAALETNHG